jgi:hypothetical protein
MVDAQMIAEKVRHLSPPRQQEVLDFVDFLSMRDAPPPLRSLEGLWQGFDVTPETLDEARLELWACFPREDIG